MPGWSRAAAAATGAGILAALLLAVPARAADPPIPSARLFSFGDDRILESSGLVDRARVVYTNNDSGDAAIVYGVDPATGRTVTTTTYAPSVHDVEAIAPGAGGTIWAGDIGDNAHRRGDVAVYQVRPLAGSHPGTRYLLRYPDGPHDAETLLVQPHTHRVFVVSKSPFGGVVYAAPRRLVSGPQSQRLRAFAKVSGLVTDGAFFPDGRHVVLRTYGTASVYTFPDFRLTGTVQLPAQPQGEGISVGPGGRVLVSSESLHSQVLAVRLPAALSTRGGVTPGRSERVSARSRAPEQSAAPARTARDWIRIALVVAGVGGLAALALRFLRVGSPHKR